MDVHVHSTAKPVSRSVGHKRNPYPPSGKLRYSLMQPSYGSMALEHTDIVITQSSFQFEKVGTHMTICISLKLCARGLFKEFPHYTCIENNGYKLSKGVHVQKISKHKCSEQLGSRFLFFNFFVGAAQFLRLYLSKTALTLWTHA